MVPPPPPPPPPLPQSTPAAPEAALDAVQEGSPELEPPRDAEPLDERPAQSVDAPIELAPGTEEEAVRDEQAPADGSIGGEGVVRRLRKGNLKRETSDALRKSRRVSFDPLALLLDASLEGELELVKKTALEVLIDAF